MDEFDFLQAKDSQFQMGDVGKLTIADIKKILKRRAQELHN